MPSDTDTMVTVPGRFLETTTATDEERAETVAREAAVTIDVVDVGSFTLLCSPNDLAALAVGFVYAEGLVERADDVDVRRIEQATPWTWKLAVALRTRPDDGRLRRSLVATSSCGACGNSKVIEMLTGPPVGNAFVVHDQTLAAVTVEMRRRQVLFGRTGGAHAAALFAADGRIVAFAEDIGRHTALDKAIGACLLGGMTPAGFGVMMSGRLSFELVLKAARSGIELLAGVSAPTSLAVEAAAARRMTLCGFVRDGRSTLYGGFHRVVSEHSRC